MTLVTECRLRVRYAETDQMGVVYYANYLVWMEVGRVELCKACGFNYRDMEREDASSWRWPKRTADTALPPGSTTKSSSRRG